MNTARKMRFSVNVLGVITDVELVKTAPPIAAMAAPSPRPTRLIIDTRIPVASTAAGTSFMARIEMPQGLRRRRSMAKPTSTTRITASTIWPRWPGIQPSSDVSRRLPMPDSPPVIPGAVLSHDWNAWANRYVMAAR